MDAGDILDIPLYSRMDSLVSFRLLDQKKEPLAGKTLKVLTPEGEVEEQTDDNGELFFEADEGEEFKLMGVVEEELPNLQISEMNFKAKGLLASSQE